MGLYMGLSSIIKQFRPTFVTASRLNQWTDFDESWTMWKSRSWTMLLRYSLWSIYHTNCFTDKKVGLRATNSMVGQPGESFLDLNSWACWGDQFNGVISWPPTTPTALRTKRWGWEPPTPWWGNLESHFYIQIVGLDEGINLMKSYLDHLPHQLLYGQKGVAGSCQLDGGAT